MDSEGGAVLVCWIVVCILLMTGGCFGWVARDVLTIKENVAHEAK